MNIRKLEAIGPEQANVVFAATDKRPSLIVKVVQDLTPAWAFSYYKTLRISNVRKIDKFCSKLVFFEASKNDLIITKMVAYYARE